jgi:hypothetical protein
LPTNRNVFTTKNVVGSPQNFTRPFFEWHSGVAFFVTSSVSDDHAATWGGMMMYCRLTLRNTQRARRRGLSLKRAAERQLSVLLGDSMRSVELLRLFSVYRLDMGPDNRYPSARADLSVCYGVAAARKCHFFQ